jgi:hypothetical protein
MPMGAWHQRSQVKESAIDESVRKRSRPKSEQTGTATAPSEGVHNPIFARVYERWA